MGGQVNPDPLFFLLYFLSLLLNISFGIRYLICFLTSRSPCLLLRLHKSQISSSSTSDSSIHFIPLRSPGRFEIVSLSGSFVISDDNGGSRTGGLNVSLAGPDGRMLGGGVAGMLTAVSTVQVVVGSFIADGKKSKSNPGISSPSSAPASSQMLNFGAPMTPTTPPSQGPSSESSDDNGDVPFNRGPDIFNNASQSQPLHNMPMYHHIWAGQSQQ